MTSKRGGPRPGSGRPKGRPNRATQKQKGTIEALARSYAPVAMKALAKIAQKGESESARVAASNSLLDRGYGRPRQSHQISGPNGGPISSLDLTNVSDEQLRTLEAIFGPLAGSGGDDEVDP